MTGASCLARTSRADVLTGLAVALFGGLLVAWVVVSTRALRSARAQGESQMLGPV